MKNFNRFISENETTKPERKIGKIKAWLSYFDKQDEPDHPHVEIEYTRRVKSSIPNAHWYFVGSKPMCKMSSYDRRCRASEVYLVTTDGMYLHHVVEDTYISKGYWGRWQSGMGSFRGDTFDAVKRHAESNLTKRLEKLAQEKERFAAKG